MKYNVLVAEDEQSIRTLAMEYVGLLGGEGYQLTVYEAANGIEALEVLSRHPKSGTNTEAGGIDLVISDVEMPGKTGLEVVAECQRISPLTKCMLWSGNKMEYQEAAEKLGVEILGKPLPLGDFVQAVKGYLGSP